MAGRPSHANASFGGVLFLIVSEPARFAEEVLGTMTVGFIIDDGVMCEPDSREPWFVSAAHDAACLADTLRAFEAGVDSTLDVLRAARGDPAAKEA